MWPYSKQINFSDSASQSSEVISPKQTVNKVEVSLLYFQIMLGNVCAIRSVLTLLKLNANSEVLHFAEVLQVSLNCATQQYFPGVWSCSVFAPVQCTPPPNLQENCHRIVAFILRVPLFFFFF